jgi:hypothetical protein
MVFSANRPRLFRVRLIPFALLASSWGALPQIAHAGYSIHSPHVELGENALEAQAYYNQDNNAAVDGSGEYKFSFEHGFTTFWVSEIEAKFAYANGSGSELKALEWENKFQLTPQGKYWADFGLLAEAEFSVQGDAHEFEFGPLIGKSFGRTEVTVNLFLEREFGPDAGAETEFSYRARLRYRLSPHFEPAIEAYGSPGDIGNFEPGDEQRHQLGPAFYGQAPLGGSGQKIEYSAAALAGLTGAGSPDWTFVLRTEYDFF